MTTSSYSLAPGETPEGLALRRKLAAQMLQQGGDTSPVQHWTQGLARLVQGGLGGYQLGQISRDEDADKEAGRQAMLSLLGGDQPHPLGPVTSGPRPPTAPPATAPDATVPIGTTQEPPTGAPLSNFGNAIAKIESGGRYDLMGPVTRTGDRAHGKYQVMGQNIGPWSEAALGRRVTPQEFLASPEIQDQIFQHRFGQYVKQYGPEGAARAWFAGEGGMNDPNRKDQLGTTVASYGQRFAQAAGVPMGSAAAMPGAAPQGAPQMPIGAPPGGAPQAPPAVPMGASAAQPQITPQQRAQITSLLGNRFTAPMAQQIITTMAQRNLVPKDPKWEKLDEATLYDQNTGRVMPVGGERRPLTDPAERARYGIPADDKRPYQLGPNNRLINPPPETRVSIDQRGEGAFAQQAATRNAARYDKLVEGGFEAQSMVADLGALRDIGSRIDPGKPAQLKAALGPYAEAVGVKIEGLDDLQAYQAIVSKLAPRMRVAGSGATSDFEMRQFLMALPTLGNTPKGNEMITNTLEALQQHRMAAADIGSRALAGEITPRQAEQELRALPNPLELWKKNRGSLPSANPADLKKKYGLE